MKKFLLILTCIIIAAMLFTVVAVAVETVNAGDMDRNGTVDANDAIYLLMHTFFQEDYPLYELTGSQGPQGEKGEKGDKGDSPTIEINQDGYWVIDGEVTPYKAEGSNEKVYEALDSAFVLQKDQFICQSQTTQNPFWSYTTSTFSGWGGSIGKPEKIDVIAITVRARDTAITQIKFHLNINDKNGESIISEVVDVNIPPFEEREILWNVPVKLENNQNSLYFSYNCNQLCDAYSTFSTSANIPSDQYQAVQTYTTDGKLLDSAAKMTNVVGNPCRFLHVRLGSMQDVLVPKDEVFTLPYEKINVFLPEEYDIAVNDNFQLFYRGVVQAVDPYNYSIKILCSKGNPYPRYFEWKPTEQDIGSYKLTLIVYDNNGIEMGRDVTTLNVHKPLDKSETKNVLCVGDSLTAGGYWVRELQRRFTETGGTIEGLGLDYLNFVGSKNSTVNGKTIKHEGYAGWTWQSFCGASSPFYDTELKDISFRSYCERNGIEKLDIVYFLLTWNGQGTAYKTNYSVDSGHFVHARKLIDKLHEEYPDAIVRCMGIQMPSQNGGMGKNYGATNGYGDTYGMLVTAMHYNKTLEEMCLMDEYKDFVKYVDVAGQFDTDYNMPSAQKSVNNRNDVKETVGTNGVHPSVAGYYQIADAAYRSLCEVFKDR